MEDYTTYPVVILCGGMGTRLSELTEIRPKPMIEIGDQPVLWHIMKTYAAFGFREFVLALGYKGEFIKDYFINYRCRAHSLTIHLGTGDVTMHGGECEDWTVHLLDTGGRTLTGGRVKRAAQFVGDRPFLLTYGDGVCNLNILDLIALHRRQGKLATVTAVRPPARFGGISFDGELVASFEEKPQIGEGWINGGYFVLEPAVADYIEGDDTIWEREPMEKLAAEGQLSAHRHDGFWQCMDTLRDVQLLEALWRKDAAPWKNWT
jgi:glucose-1-phosphate cytidylyltransferase